MVTKTTNPLHFEDLDPLRFEDLSFNLIYRQKNWKSLIHLGKSGSDGGIDIDGEELGDEEPRKWLIQCKRYKSIGPSQIEKILHELVQKNPDYKFIHLIVSCPISRTCFEKIDKVKNELSLTEVEVWTNSNLEALLYHNYHDLLNVYFGLSIPGSFEERIATIEKRKQYRDLFKKELLKPFDPSQSLFGPHKFHDKKFIIRSLHVNDNEQYKDHFGWYSYFAVEPYDITDYGIEVIIDLKRGLLNDKGEMIENNDAPSSELFFQRALLPYVNIQTFDLNSDENRPVFYCIYDGLLGPFDKVYWVHE